MRNLWFVGDGKCMSDSFRKVPDELVEGKGVALLRSFNQDEVGGGMHDKLFTLVNLDIVL